MIVPAIYTKCTCFLILNDIFQVGANLFCEPINGATAAAALLLVTAYVLLIVCTKCDIN